ncbi:MAG: D-arabinono-1,4-lactone oxidase [Bacteroidia bacterium]|nr:FAD-binding protein [Bacteroidia bacterium]MDW8159752.1 D-arabinono-1,4-lactone oxidase [Bacteroidia bacterium]
MRPLIQNWSGILQFRPQNLFFPSSLEEIISIVKSAKGKKIRVIGSCHSWPPLIETEEIVISLKNFQGIEHLDKEKRQATVRAGTQLRYLGHLLYTHGLAMENLGDIDEQSIAGAISTGTHGTGQSFGIIATQVIEITLITAKGEIVTCSNEKEPNLFKAAQVSLGTLGIIALVKLQLVPAYNLECIKSKENFETCLSKVDQYRNQHRNYEFFWFPYSDIVCNKFLNLTDKQPENKPIKKFLVDVVYENGVFKLASEVARIFPNFSPSISQLGAKGISVQKEVHYSHKIYASSRLVRFNEMEYALPAEKGPQAMRELKAWIEKNQIQVHFPVEYRYTKGDDIWLSPAYERDSCFIAVHMYKGMPYQKYFEGVEEILLSYQGRPHWGKLHTQKAEYLSQVYPKLKEFLSWRQSLDPEQIFLNSYLKELLGV